LRALAPLDPEPVFTRVEDGGAIPPEELLRRWRRFGARGQTAANPEAAVRLAADLRRSARQPIVIAGSLYLVGAVRGMLRGEEEDA
jgi:folylpolyglutamate synthase/dihydropteroate synthase